ncbi:MAG: cache domain-containing protein, partial [Rhodanobacteraceae bacterium]
DVAEFADDLRRCMRGDAVRAAPDNAWQRVQRGIARHRQRVLIAILALIAVSAATVVGLLWHNREVVEQQNLREQRLLEVRNRVDRAGDLVQTRLLQLEGALSDLGSSTQQALRFATAGDNRIYLLDDFKNPARAPDDLVPLPQFGGQVSLAWPVWTLAAGVDPATATARIRRVANLRAFYKDLFGRIDSVVNGHTVSIYDAPPATAPVDMRQVAALGIALGLTDGVALRYPGWTGLPPGYDPRSQAWYRMAMNQHRPQWTDPTPATASRPSVFTVSVPLYDDEQHFLGALALILVPQRFLHDLLDLGDLEGLHEVLLTDAHGDVLAFSHHRNDRALGARATRIAQTVLKRVQGHSGNTMTTQIEGAERVVVVDDIDPLGWHLIAVAEPAAALKN